jgi:hypothetical protein
MRRFAQLTIFVLIGTTLTLPIDSVWGQNKNDGQRPSIFYSFSYTPIYQFETDLDRGGNFDVNRHYFRFNMMRSFGRKLRLGLGLSYDYEKWDFDQVLNIAGATPWSQLHRPGASLPIFYALSDRWTFGFTPSIEFYGESGAEIDESFIYGGVLSLAHTFGDDLTLGLGFGVFDQLEETAFFPFIVIDWKINEQFRITNPFRAGPAGPAGLELVYTPAQKWELGLGGAYRSYRFRLDDRSAVPNGVGENEYLVTFLRVQRTLGQRFTLDLAGGALFGGELSIEDANGDKIGSDKYDPSPFAALTFGGKF